MTVRMFPVFVALLVLSAAVPAACGAQALPDSSTARFDALDVNHDGVVSQYEYDSDVALAALDSNHDGHVSPAELQGVLGYWEGGPQSAERRVSLADLDRDGQLSNEELRRALEFRFKTMDQNKDGNLDLNELHAGMGVPMMHRGKH
jgi:Ca2+-binding EF-hand superfamily protein